MRVPNDDTALELLRETGPLAVSSANRTGKPAALDIESAMDQLGESVDVYLDGGPRGETGEDVAASTIIDCTGEQLKVVRAGTISIEELRVVVPEVLDLGQDAPGQDA
ncbi:Sua5/YciO/YrdC/YwlC family protein [Glutamicibacter sp. M10]|uniref:L-threonylcarbamoyladenylate synthase n=1 Tax=Glutamicibacter sp. M10 TaxID=3023076 RepID=UPI002905635E|nr:Sua5/YciO/YrdC/YwlC family protein [Glutamicibacter sp. M10]